MKEAKAISSATPPVQWIPKWYSLHQTPDNEPYIALPPRDTKREPGLRIFLTRLQLSDAQANADALSLPSINDRLISLPKPYTLANAEYWINLQRNPSTTTSLPLEALRRDDPVSGKIIGAVGLSPRTDGKHSDGTKADAGTHELGYWLHPDYEGVGIMTDGVKALLSYAVLEKGCKRVVVRAAVDNPRSRGVIESFPDFRSEGEAQMVKWPEAKGGGEKMVESWRWTF